MRDLFGEAQFDQTFRAGAGFHMETSGRPTVAGAQVSAGFGHNVETKALVVLNVNLAGFEFCLCFGGEVGPVDAARGGRLECRGSRRASRFNASCTSHGP